MKINGKEIKLLPKRLAVELYWNERAKDTMEFGSTYYQAHDLALMIWASAAAWSKVNMQGKQIEFSEIFEYIESVDGDEAKDVAQFCTDFVESNFYKTKVETIQKRLDEIEEEKKSLIGTNLEGNVSEQV